MAQSIRDIIAANDGDFVAAFGRGDAAGLASFYTEDGQLLPPNSDFIRGKEAVQAFWQAVLDMGIKGIKIDIVEVEGHGDTAIEVSTYEMHGDGGQVLDAGKFIVIWKRESGQWKLHRDIFNSSMPAPQ